MRVYGTGLNGGQPANDLPADQTHVTFHLQGAYGPSMSQMFADQYCSEGGGCRGPHCARMRNTWSSVDAFLMTMAISAAIPSCET